MYVFAEYGAELCLSKNQELLTLGGAWWHNISIVHLFYMTMCIVGDWKYIWILNIPKIKCYFKILGVLVCETEVVTYTHTHTHFTSWG